MRTQSRAQECNDPGVELRMKRGAIEPGRIGADLRRDLRLKRRTRRKEGEMRRIGRHAIFGLG